MTLAGANRVGDPDAVVVAGDGRFSLLRPRMGCPWRHRVEAGGTATKVNPAYHRSMGSTPAPGLHELVEQRRDAIKDAARRHRGVSISLFGSLARGTDNESSDADFLVEFEPGSSLFDLLHLQDELQELLGRPVDVVSVAGLKARDDRIRREAITL